MEAVDATERSYKGFDGPPPSLLTIILDTNPHAWQYLSPSLPLAKAIANLLVFVNAHLAINSANQVAVLASHTHHATWLYPTPHLPKAKARPAANGNKERNGGVDGDVDMQDTPSADDANKYRPFRNVETELLANLRALIAQTSEADLKASTTTLVAGALTTALAYIAKANIKSAPQVGDTQMADLATAADPPAARSSLTSRILVLSVSGDLASQYIPVMNAIFAAQRQRIPIDILKLAGDTIFLQQACDATGGIYMQPSAPQGLLQYLMMAFLPDETARKHLVLPSAGEVDFRAACFCHRRVVDVGYVCSVCLSIFCEPPADQTCPTCTNPLSVSSSITRVPALIPRKKKKRKRVAGEATPAGTPGTPGGGATPIPS
ncbi:Transcription factor Tfb4 [Neofusicoccum parvum]|uniref:General transcription and DNA repair factor IIH subunit TFB4 n=3 Tax=Neofusicoccum TaxID=407951 RepID=R1GT35_BOTPV|nr:putative transcription factor tfiih subunit protein [Neofusicoccum parvum UCRNP2]GME51334.1 Transcription factor Tfb4 [Neofusicoccum parvum]GME65762.1 Transcription factor Tfb4 [Neofusicoccum parvum]